MVMTRKDWLMLTLLSVLWGGSFLFNGIIVGHVPALSAAWLRVTIGAAILALVLAGSGIPFPRGLRVWRPLAVMGLLNNAVPFTLFVLAQGEISAGLASILNATTPLFTLLVAHLATGDDRLSAARITGLACGFLGVVVMLGGAALTADKGAVAAQIACLCAALSYGLATVWGRRFQGLGLAPMTTAFGMLAASSVILAPFALILDRPWTAPAPSTAVVLAILGLGALSTALAYRIFFGLLARIGAVNLSLVTFLVPISAIAMGIAVLGETLALRHVAGFLLVATGLIAIDGRLRARLSRARPPAA